MEAFTQLTIHPSSENMQAVLKLSVYYIWVYGAEDEHLFCCSKKPGMQLLFLLATFISSELMSYHVIAITSVQLWSDMLCFIPLQQITVSMGNICAG